MEKFVISLVSAVERREHIRNQFEKNNLDFEYFDAVQGDNLDEMLALRGLSHKNYDLTKGEIGCLLSHVDLWNKIVERKIEYMAIFEDDIYLGEQSEYFLKSYDWIPENIDLVKIEAFSSVISVNIFARIPLRDEYNLYPLKSRHLGTAGYIISYHGAKKLLNYIKSLDEIVPVDNIMFDHYVSDNTKKIYQLLPAICIQDFIFNSENTLLSSSIQAQRTVRQNKDVNTNNKKLSFLDKLKRELFRLIFQILKLPKKIWHKKVKFK